ncbi:MAG: endonuclease/exonuclease/phosphatase family protein [Phycisphaeraceae bacterium]
MNINCFVFSTAFTMLLLLVGCQTSSPTKSSAELDVMSFNIRNGKANDGENRWERRRELVCGVIQQYKPDVLGVQEAYRFQLDELATCLPGYREIGEGRDGGTANEYCAILYRAERFDVAASGTFWLSDTPEVVSKSWGNTLHRVCTWARLIDKNTGRSFYFYNTHFDHRSQNARVESAKLIAKRIADREYDDPVVLAGDFNAGEDNHAVRYLKGIPYEVPVSGPAFQYEPPIALVDTFRVAHPDATVVGTGNGGYTGKQDGAKIDYVFVTRDIEVIDAAIDQEPRDGRYPSDHYPVTAKLQLIPLRPKISEEDLQQLESDAEHR